MRLFGRRVKSVWVVAFGAAVLAAAVVAAVAVDTVRTSATARLRVVVIGLPD